MKAEGILTKQKLQKIITIREEFDNFGPCVIFDRLFKAGKLSVLKTSFNVEANLKFSGAHMSCLIW